jgi:hypothetical protein
MKNSCNHRWKYWAGLQQPARQAFLSAHEILRHADQRRGTPAAQQTIRLQGTVQRDILTPVFSIKRLTLVPTA